MNIYIGTSGFGYREWKGKFYPEKTEPGEMLRFYGKRFKTVEINNTFYRMPREDMLLSWAEQVPDDFVFSIKAPQVITHLKQLRNVSAETEYFFRSLSVLGKKLGPILFQFPKSFRVDHAVLKSFLGLIPDGLSCAFNFRSPSWLDPKTMSILRDRACSYCMEDTDEKPAEEMVNAAAWGYLRLRRSDYTEADLAGWREKILTQQWEKAFVYFKHEEEAKGPKLALRFQELIDFPAIKRLAS